MKLADSVVEDAAPGLESLGYAVKHDPKIAPGELTADHIESGTFFASRAILPTVLSGEVRLKDTNRSQERTV